MTGRSPSTPGRQSVSSQARLCTLESAPATPLPAESRKLDGSMRSFQNSSSRKAPVDSANWLSFTFLSWMNPLVQLGNRQTLEQDDLPRVGQRDEASGLCRDLGREWQKEIGKQKPSLLKACARVWARSVLIQNMFYYGVFNGISLVQPYFLGKLIDRFTCQESLQSGYLYAMGFILLSFIRAFTYHPAFFASQRELGMQVRTAMSSLIHNTVLQLSHSALLKVTTGHVINLISTDVQRFDEVSQLVPSLWWGPIMIIAVVILVYWQIGVSCFAGFAIIPVIFFLQVFSSRLMARFRDRTARETDKRIRLMNEIITGMQLIKMYVWEAPFRSLVESVRNLEMGAIKNRQVLFAMNAIIQEVGVGLLAFIMFTTYVYIGDNQLTPGVAFQVLSLLQVLRFQVLMLFVFAINISAECKVAIDRIQDFLLLAKDNTVFSAQERHVNVDYSVMMSELPDAEQGHSESVFMDDSPQQAVSTFERKIHLQHVCATWSQSTESDRNGSFLLSDISLTVDKGELLAVVGTVGCGKTSLLMAILGELNITRGHCHVHGDIGYAAQVPWIYSGTIRENILFGKELEIDKYEEILSACGLDEDVVSMHHGDLTLVGERGVKLSGGQKARIGLARALYQDAAVYLLDDPLSAVDVEVGQVLFSRCIRGLLKDKPVILVTHQTQFLNDATHIMVLNEGKSLGTFTYSELLSSGLEVARSLVDKEENVKEDDPDEKVTTKAKQGSGDAEEMEEMEDRAIGSVKLRDYWRYVRAGASAVTIILLLLLCAITQGTLTVGDWWLAYWTTRTTSGNSTIDPLVLKDCPTSVLERNAASGVSVNGTSAGSEYGNGFYVAVWGGLLGLAVILSLSRGILVRFVFIAASKRLQSRMLSAILRAPMLFFDTNPSGRVLNRFSKDTSLLDINMPWLFYDTVVWTLAVGAIVIFASVINPWTLVCLPPLLVAYYYLQHRYISAAREIKRLEAIARSPVFSHFSATLQGLTTIRAFHAETRLQETFNELLDAHSRGWLCFLGATRWLAVRLELISMGYLTGVTFAALLVFDFGNDLNLDAGTFGLTISYQLAIYGCLQWVVRSATEVENMMTSTERIFSYCSLEPEKQPDVLQAIEPSNDWPQYGIITGERMTYRYSPDGAAVLKSLNFCIRHKEKVGIVGRTGAGKSSFINALFRLAPTSGKVMIDGVRLDEVPLSTMRQKLSIIPQDPVLYSGSLRYNLDPFEKYQDEKIWHVLDMVQLKDYVWKMEAGLGCELSESGANLSVGQRQLVCLARALLDCNRILLIDEATANVDNQTDSVIQRTLREHFKECTVVTIAHRLNTIMDSDRIMVIDDGRIKEFDEPLYLLDQKEDSVFADMVNSHGDEEAKRLREACRLKQYWTEAASKDHVDSSPAPLTKSSGSGSVRLRTPVLQSQHSLPLHYVTADSGDVCSTTPIGSSHSLRRIDLTGQTEIYI